MKINNEFDKKVELYRSSFPVGLHEAFINVVDTLDICLAAARAVFEDKATSEQAFKIYDRLMKEVENKKNEDGAT